MRFSTSLLLAVPVASVAAEGMFDQYKAQFQNFLSNFGVDTPSADTPKAAAPVVEDFPAPAAGEEEPAAGPKGTALHSLTLSNWKDTLYEPVPEGATTPEEWWVFMSGGNKTCRGYCARAEAAWKVAANNFADLEDETPHMALIDCEEEQVLCNSLGGGAGSIWSFEMLPPPADIDIYITRVNLSSVTPEIFQNLRYAENRPAFQKLETVLHPFNSYLAKYNVLLPLGYVLYYLSFIPNWAFMFIISAFSRRLMSRRMENHQNRNAAAPAAAPAQ